MNIKYHFQPFNIFSFVIRDVLILQSFLESCKIQVQYSKSAKTRTKVSQVLQQTWDKMDHFQIQLATLCIIQNIRTLHQLTCVTLYPQTGDDNHYSSHAVTTGLHICHGNYPSNISPDFLQCQYWVSRVPGVPQCQPTPSVSHLMVVLSPWFGWSLVIREN